MFLHADRRAATKNKHFWISQQRIVAVVVAAVMLFGFAAFLQTRLSMAAGSTASDGPTAPDGPNSPGVPKSLAMASPASYEQGLLPFLKKYCVDCHGDGAHSGDFSFDRYRNLDALKRDRHIWTKALKLLKIEAMPPADADPPPAEERAQAVKWLDHQLFYVDCSLPQDPGRVTVRRLNKTEYNNTIRDLLGIDFHPANDFPSDDTGHGFDNIGDVLTIPPLLLEKYLDAAEDIARRAVRAQPPLYSRTLYTAKPRGNVRDLVHGKVLITSGDTVFQSFEFPRAGRYVIRVQAKLDGSGDVPAKMEVRFGTKVVGAFEIKKAGSLNVFETTLDTEQGPQKVSATVKSKFNGNSLAEDATPKKDSTPPKDATPKKDGSLAKDATPKKGSSLQVISIEVEGPLGFTDQERRADPVVCVLPQRDMSAAAAARVNLKRFLPRAFRREVPADECERYVVLVQRALDHGDTFNQAMNMALQAVLISPHFLFRVEDGRRREAGIEMLDDFALASRLSYFVWASMPDDELFRLAGQNRLHEPDQLKAQTLRLLNDPRADALVTSFASQWLGLRRLASNDVKPDAGQFPGFDDELRRDLCKETELFFGSIMRSNRSIYELLNGRYTFLNQRLARHYGINGISGPEFRRFEFSQEQRAGVVTQGSVLTLTSHPGRTSPVRRGEWVLANLLGDAPPAPPPAVPALEQTRAANPTMTLRQQMERHRADPNCASCHKVMDAIGFGLESFDPVGRWRDRDGARPIDSKGALPTGEVFNGPIELVAILNERKADFGRCLTERMLTYALGRGVEWYDKCAVDEIVSRLKEDDRFSTLILGIVNTAAFQLRRAQKPLL
jgi:hypothetical protein